MKNTTLLFLILAFSVLSSHAICQSLDTTISFYSNFLSENRTIKIGVPHNYFESKDTFSTLYILDAEYRYDFCRSTQQYLGISTRIPNTIIVGIPNLSPITRNRDLLPSNFGGVDSLFRKFIELEVIPLVEDSYRCNSERILAGHSHAGVFVVNTLIQNSTIFNKYIATDPSFQIINSNLPESLPNLSDKSLYITSSDGLYGFNQEVSSDMFTNNVIFQNYRVQNSDSGLKFYAEHIQDDHGNSFMTAFHRGLRWVHNWPISESTLKN